MPRCYHCETFEGPSINKLLLHLQSHHQISDLKGRFSCGEDNCFRSFSGWKSFSNHLSKEHHFCQVQQQEFQPEQPKPTVPLPVGSLSLPGTSSKTPVSQISLLSYTPENASSIDGSSLTQLKNNLQDRLLHILSDLASRRNLPRKIAQEVAEGIQQMLNDNYHEIRNLIFGILRKENVSESTYKEIDQVLIETTSEAMKSVSTEHRRKMLLTKANYYIEPVNITVDTDEQLRPGIVTPVTVTSAYVDPSKILTLFLNKPGMLTCILDHLATLSDGTSELSSYMHSPAWKRKIAHYEDKTVWPINIYFDDAQMNNELGQHGDTGSMGIVQMLLPFLPPHLQTKLENIFVVQIFRSADRLECGNKNMFKKLITDISKCSVECIPVPKSNGEIIPIYFLLGSLQGDNSGLNDILGFVKGFRANFFCRICRAHRSLTEVQCVEDVSLLRTKQQYEEALVTNNQTLTGIREPCVWNACPEFHVVDDETVDVMHDFFSNGIVNYDLGEILHYLILEAKVISLELFNIKLALFHHSPSKNIPPSIKEDHLKNKKISMSAAECETLCRCLALLIGDLVYPTDEVWAFYLVLRKIIDIVLCRRISEGDAEVLTCLIREHNSSYQSLFGKKLVPKMHFLVHYPRLLLKLGPLVNLSCFRPEGKNKQQKATSKATTSRINLPKTLLIKEQLNFAFQSLSDSSVDECDGLHDTSPAFLQVGFYVTVALDEDGYLPIFGKIEEMIPEVNGLSLRCVLFRAVLFSSHFHAWQVKDSEEESVLNYEQLRDPTPALFTIKRGKSYITLKHL